jgi:hypothetical protein
MIERFIVVLIGLLIVFSPCVVSNPCQKKSGLPDEFIIEDITMQDGGYHIAKNMGVEWWYFDANLNDNISVQIGLMLVSRNTMGLVFPGINIYDHGQEVYHRRKICSFGTFSGLEEKPLIYFKNVPYINGTIDEETGIAKYKVMLSFGEAAVSLYFNSTVRGWKTGTWAVIMPKATVTGVMYYNNQVWSVEGEGYHEHKWDMPLTFAIESKGGYWGRILSNSTSLVWTEINPRLSEKRILAVLNVGADEYMKVEEEDFAFQVLKYFPLTCQKIPMKFELQIENETIAYDVILTAINYQHIQFLTKQYWRYSVQIDGNVTIQGKVDELIRSYGIMDRTKFSFFV